MRSQWRIQSVPVRQLTLDVYTDTSTKKTYPYFLDVRSDLGSVLNSSVVIAACGTGVPIKMPSVCFMSFYRQAPTPLFIRINHIGVK